MTDGDIIPVTDAAGVAGRDDDGMIGNGSHHRRPTDEERAFFDALMLMRDRYAARGRDDATSVIGLRHAIVAANAAMAATARHGATN